MVNYGDSYKYSHGSQYPKNMISMYDYLESRGGLYPSTIFVGLTYYLKKYLSKQIFIDDVNRARDMAARHGIPFDYAGWCHIVLEHGGYLPIRIRAIEEGSLVPTKHVLMSIESTDPEIPWIAGFVETILMKLWFPINVATTSYFTRKILEKYGHPDWAQFALHNFSDRGNSSVESAAIAGFAHLTQFSGTDNFNSLFFCEDYYGVKSPDVAGYSVFATEHSTTTANCSSTSREDRLKEEEEFVYNQLLANQTNTIMSFVADSTDVYAFTDFCTNPTSRIRQLVESRPHQKLVLRPDSGTPLEVIGRMLDIISSNSPTIIYNSEKILFKDFGILWGDGITPVDIESILEYFTTEAGTHNIVYAAENFVFGMGGGLVNSTRDTQKFAIKCSSITIAEDNMSDGYEGDGYSYTNIDVYKDPITDPGKASKRGQVTTWFNTETKEYSQGKVGQQPSPHHIDALRLVFEDGELYNIPTLASIRSRTP